MAATNLDNTTWKLVSYFDGATVRALPTGAEVTLTFQGGAAGGHSACNRYSSSVTIRDDTLAFGQTLSTKMACPPPLMEIEQTYLRTLGLVALWSLSDGTLVLRDSAAQTLLMFTRT